MNTEDANESAGRSGSNGVSVSTTLSVIVAAIAVLLGFLILRDVNRVSDDSNESGGNVTTVVGPTGESTVAPTDTTALPRSGFKVMVANASGITGSAGQMSTALQSEQFIVTQPVNADVTIGKQSVTVVYYVEGYSSGATAVAEILGGLKIEPVPTPVPVQDGSLGEAQVLIMLGTDLAGKLLPGALPTVPVEAATTTVAPA
jgi:Mrp family chromosome partitioning ATPase